MENNVADEVLEKLCKNGVIVYDKLPKDWKIIKDATTNPKGYKWINNGKSRFSKNYKQGLLIDEHFKPKENTSEFKHFKLHSDSTLKNLTKVELIDYIKMLYHNWGVADEQLKNCIDKAKELSDSNDELERTIHSLDCELSDVYNPKPYKFEDLKPNMWLWNDKRKRCFRLTDAFIRAGTKYYRWLDLSSGKLVRERFVEGQLYPPTKAMEYQEGN